MSVARPLDGTNYVRMECASTIILCLRVIPVCSRLGSEQPVHRKLNYLISPPSSTSSWALLATGRLLEGEPTVSGTRYRGRYLHVLPVGCKRLHAHCASTRVARDPYLVGMWTCPGYPVPGKPWATNGYMCTGYPGTRVQFHRVVDFIHPPLFCAA
eukprot:2969798-Rhodomonas_salina.1